MNKHLENNLQKACCDWLMVRYPKVLFNADLSGIKLSIGQAKRIKSLRSNSGFPDMAIYKKNCAFNGIFIEFKKESPYLKNGSLSSIEHIQKQNQIMDKLANEGFYCFFCWKLEIFIENITNYMQSI